MPSLIVPALLMTAGTALSCAAVTWLARLLLLRLRVLDHPNERSSHVAPTPRGGGIAPALIILAAWSWLSWPLAAQAQVLIGAAFALALLSLLDDLRGLDWRLRFGAQAVAVSFALAVMPDPILLPHGWLWLDHLAIGLGWLWFINLYNFMDGIDGLAATQTATIGAGSALAALGAGLAGDLPLQGAAIAGAALGFLVWNRPPAKIFLGDAGSITLGFLTGSLLIALAGRGLLAAAILLPAYFVCDATWTLAGRILRRQAIWQAHRDHAYQKAVQGGLSHGAVTGRIAILNLLLLVLALEATDHPWPALAAGLAATCGLMAWLALRRGGGKTV